MNHSFSFLFWPFTAASAWLSQSLSLPHHPLPPHTVSACPQYDGRPRFAVRCGSPLAINPAKLSVLKKDALGERCWLFLKLLAFAQLADLMARAPVLAAATLAAV